MLRPLLDLLELFQSAFGTFWKWVFLFWALLGAGAILPSEYPHSDMVVKLSDFFNVNHYFSFRAWLEMGIGLLFLMIFDFAVKQRRELDEQNSGPIISKGLGTSLVRWEPKDERTRIQHFRDFLDRKIVRLEQYLKYPKRNFEWVTLWEASVENAFVTAGGEKAGEAVARQLKTHEESSYLKFDEERALDEMIKKHILYLKDTKKSMTARKLLENFNPENLRKFEKE
jgi:hypothetical protein